MMHNNSHDAHDAHNVSIHIVYTQGILHHVTLHEAKSKGTHYIRLEFLCPHMPKTRNLNTRRLRIHRAYVALPLTATNLWYIKQVVTCMRGEWLERFDTHEVTPRALFRQLNGTKHMLRGTIMGYINTQGQQHTIWQWQVHHE